MMTDKARRREFASTLSRIGRASVAEILRMEERSTETASIRIGITGPPGAGKSTLIGNLVAARATPGPPGRPIAVVAIDPTSPISGGAILGDRIRMDAIAAHPNVFVRSIASGTSEDGLAENLVEILAAADTFGFAEIYLETVGGGQLVSAVHRLVDVLILVTQWDSGDVVQTMKSGALELADIIVVTKGTRQQGDKMAADLRSIWGRFKRRDQTPAIFRIDSDGSSLAELSSVVDEKIRSNALRDRAEVLRNRRRQELRSLSTRLVDELLAGAEPLAGVPLRASLGQLGRKLTEIAEN